MNSASHYADLARHAIQPVLAGDPPNGTKPEDCGPWQPVVKGVFDGWHSGGTDRARKVFNTLASGDVNISKMMAAGTDQGAPAAHVWGGVLPFHKVDLPAFPLEIFPPWLREYCEAVTTTLQTPTDLAGMLALSVLSTACAQRIAVMAWPGFTEPTNVYTVTSLPPGSRKSPVFKSMTGPIRMFERQLTEKVQTEIESGEIERDILKHRLEEAKRKAGKAQGESATKMAFSDVDGIVGEIKDLVIPKTPKLIVDDVTPEPLASILAEHGRVAILSAEGDIFAIMAGRYSSGAPNIGVYKKGHTGEDLRVERRNRSEYVESACITMGITTQPEVMRSFGQNAAFRSEGLLARFFYALPKSTVGTRVSTTPPIPDHVRSRYYRLVLDLLESLYSGDCGNSGNKPASESGDSGKNLYKDDSTNITTLEISIPGKERIRAFMDWLEPQLGDYGSFQPIVDWASKLTGAVLRVSGLLHMAEQVAHNSHNTQNEVSDANVARAIHLAHYLIAHAQAAYAEIGADPAVESAKLILRWIEKTDTRAFTKRDCYQGVRGTFKRATDLDPVLELLVDHSYLREVPMPERDGPGRKPSPSYEVNPIVLDGAHNSHNTQNSGASYEAPPPPPYEEPGFRSVGGYDE